MLIFRVGAVDETLPTHGITHLVEHLAMFPLMQTLDATSRLNATVEPFRTRFMATGTPQEVASFLSDVTSNLTALPLDRVENEKRVLRTEAANRTTGSVKAAWSWRFGAVGPGLIDFEEYGLRWLTADHVGHWAQSWFTAGNAVVWLSGPVPENFKLNLKKGARNPVPALRSLKFATPAIYQQGDRWALLSMLGPRTTAINLGTRIFDSRLRDRIRHQASIAYEVHATYQRLDPDTAEITAFADSLAPNAKNAAQALVDVTRDLAASGPSVEEIAAVQAERRRAREHPESGLALLEQEAIEELEGLERKSVEELEAEAQALTPADVAKAFQEALPTAVLAIPREVTMTIAGFTPIPLGSGERAKGAHVSPMPGSGHSDVIDYSDQGISLTQPNRTTIGMRWSDVVVAPWWSDGRRSLINTDGAGIHIVPAKWQLVQPLVEAIRRRVPQERWIPMDEPDAVPRAPGPICAICEATPAIEVSFQDPRSAFVIRVRKVHGVVCRDCGIAKFREVQRRVLVSGWWSIPGLLVTPIALLSNTAVYFRLRRLPVPIRSSGINPLPKGRTVWLYPGMLIPAAGLLFLLYLFWPR
jgi:predicted Zn-dependent peptidase